MVHPSTALALKSRALRAANGLEYWGKRLSDELKKQSIEQFGQEARDYKGDLFDDPRPFTLKRGEVMSLLHDMLEYKDELRRFAK